jgi:4-hydroxybenzoate polyprenyltransferase
MRSAGCAVNDYADRNFDRHVKRTQYRPLTAGEIEPKEALAVAAVLAVMAFGCVLFLNQLTIFLSFMALAIAVSYPFTKRFFSIPQAILGIAFGFGIPMAYAAELGQVPLQAYILLSANIFWAIAYDTAYAMVDREDDLRIGIRTSAITFGSYDVLIIFLCYVAFLSLLGYLAVAAQLNHWFWVGWLTASGCAGYHFLLVRTRNPAQCFQAFNHNNYLGACIFAGIFFAYW